jgi:ribosomal-protein-alanine N-acetyltransferase
MSMRPFSPCSFPSLPLLDTVIKSGRLRLTPTTEADAEDIFRTFTAEVTRYMFPKPAERLEDTLTFIEESRRATEAGVNLQLTISAKAAGEFLGCCGLHGHESVRTPELGVWIKRQAHGYGYGREAVLALVGWAVNALEVSGFVYPVDRRNAASRKIPEALGGEVVSTTMTTGQAGNRLELVTYRIDATNVRTVLQRESGRAVR